jgi:alpha/beta superfamily hydrolase
MTANNPSKIRSIDDLHGPSGRLEAVLNSGQPDAPYAVLVCHPHPMGGGTMHN